MQSPMGQMLVHDGFEAIIVTPHDQVRHFMHDDVFKKFRPFLGQLSIETDAAFTWGAASPSGLHMPHKEPRYVHAHHRFPPGD